jgi:lysophospholipase L1-like esterase
MGKESLYGYACNVALLGTFLASPTPSHGHLGKEFTPSPVRHMLPPEDAYNAPILRGNEKNFSDPSILILGDSITEFGFGRELTDELKERKMGSTVFVEGYPGYTSKMVLLELLEGTIPSSSMTPDILLIELGTNDALRGKYTIEQTVDYISQIITFFRDKNTNVKVILFPVIPSAYGPKTQQRVEALNDAYGTLVESITTADSPVILSEDVADNFDTQTDLVDRIHPSRTGYEKMAISATDAIDIFWGP